MLETRRPLKVFLCHASGDAARVRALYTRLKRGGVDVWLDKEKLLPGEDWELEIRKAVREADVVVVCLSNQFNQAGFRQKEVRLALDTAMEQPEGEIFIIPARLEECDTPESLRKWQWVNLFEVDGYQRLIRALRVRADKMNAIIPLHKGGRTIDSPLGINERKQPIAPRADPGESVGAPRETPANQVYAPDPEVKTIWPTTKEDTSESLRDGSIKREGAQEGSKEHLVLDRNTLSSSASSVPLSSTQSLDLIGANSNGIIKAGGHNAEKPAVSAQPPVMDTSNPEVAKPASDGILTRAPSMTVAACTACVVAGIGCVLYYQNRTGDWTSWTFLWTLMPGWIGIGVIITALLGKDTRHNLGRGIDLVVFSGVLFLFFAAIFGHRNVLGPYGPAALLILSGLYIMVGRGLLRGRRSDRG